MGRHEQGHKSLFRKDVLRNPLGLVRRPAIQNDKVYLVISHESAGFLWGDVVLQVEDRGAGCKELDLAG